MGKNENLATKVAVFKEFEKVGFTNYYLRMFNNNLDISNRVELLLKFIDADPSKMGYTFLKDALEYIFKNSKDRMAIPAATVYEFVAKKRNTCYQAVERNIRTVKEECWENMKNQDLKTLIFGNTYTYKRPGNMVFLYQLYHFLLNDIC